MGFLGLFRSRRSRLLRLPSGSFTLDRAGRVMTSTLPHSFPASCLKAIGRQVLAAFQTAKQAQMPLSEIIIHYSALKLLARELRGGAIIFIMPQALNQPLRKN